MRFDLKAEQPASRYTLYPISREPVTTHYQLQQSAGDDVVRALVRDRQGTLWVEHASGLLALDPASPPQTPTIRRYTTRDA